MNLGNLNVHFVVSILQKAGRGVPFNYQLAYDNSMWYPVTSGGSTVWTPVDNWGWQGLGPIFAPYVSYSMTTFHGFCGSMGTTPYSQWNFSNFVYHDANNTSHYFGSGGAYIQSPGGTFCPPNGQQPSTISPSTAPDGSGYTLKNMSLGAGTVSATLVSADGSTIGAAFLTTPPASPSPFTMTDSNGNRITASNAVYTDTLGTTVLTATGTPPSNTLFTYTPPTGPNVPYTVSYHTYTVTTFFGCSGVTEYNQTGKFLVDRVTLPDGNYYEFTYERTNPSSASVTGRIASVRLPTGGTITYAYSGGTGTGTNPINCADGSTAIMTRTLSPGGTWAYARSGTAPHWTTTISDPTTPIANQTAIDFQGIYETQRKVYQGSATGTPLAMTITCYNGVHVSTPTSCPNDAITLPILRTTVFSYAPDTSGLRSETDSIYDTFGFINEVDEYDYGAATPTRKTISSYTALGNGIVDRPSSVVIKDGNNVVQASTTYGYDETTVTTTSGTPQHVSVAGSRGNLTSVTVKANATINLYRKFTYYDTGLLNTSPDVSTSSTTNGVSTTYNYAAGTGSCGNSFVTSISEPLMLSRSMTWDCNGGVLLSLTDENSKISSTAYSGPNYTNKFWRPYSTTDPSGNITYFTYPSFTTTESVLTFNGVSSVIDQLTTVDGLGRTVLSQTRQGPSPSNFSSVETDYNAVGQVSKVTLPYNAAAGVFCSGTCPGTTMTYDGLGRVLTTTDGGGGTTTNSYTKNDVLQTVGPAPAGENTKRKQHESDALGRLTSVCEVSAGTAAFPGGLCNQSSTQTGYWTTYTYDVLGNRTGVTQNAQAGSGQQTRAFTYDMLGRLLSETNPETNNAAMTYAYDKLTSDAACGTVDSAGNMVKLLSAGSNAACYSYDSLHRATTIIYPSSSTAAKHFVYDSATVNGTAMANAKTRLAQAYTCTGTCSGKITDLGLSYSANGQITDVWESTPHSGGYYHATSTYWENGALKTMSGVPSFPTITFGVDAAGRTSTVSASSGQNPVTSTSYNIAGQVTGLTLGSSDNDVFAFDANTGRMTDYTYNVGTAPQSVIGHLTWNSNGSVKQLQITDPLNSSNQQTCNYAHDDLSRVSSANCGSLWNQAFSFDPFGNITKTATAGISFQPTYDTSKNRMSSSPFTYDGNNGNLTADNSHAYTWDAAGKMISVDAGTANGVCLTYDAMDRMVEQGKGPACTTSYTEILYSPSGSKLALMNGQNLTKAFVGLPAGAQAVYTASGLAYYRHPDWLGSSRLATTPTRTMYYDVAYAPYGEPYAGSGTQDLSFTGQNQDTAPSVVPGGAGGLYDFLYREHTPVQGRWLSPDPAGLGAVSPGDPQSWNRYAYVGNRPLGTTDSLGLFESPILPPCDPFWDGCGGNPPGPCVYYDDPGCYGGGPFLPIPPPPRPQPPTGNPFPSRPDRRVGGKWPGNETLGLPSGLNLRPLGLEGLGGLTPGTGCDFGVCASIGNGFSSDIDWFWINKTRSWIQKGIGAIECWYYSKKCTETVLENSKADNVNHDPMKGLDDAIQCQQQGRTDCSTMGWNNVTRTGMFDDPNCQKAFKCGLKLTVP